MSIFYKTNLKEDKLIESKDKPFACDWDGCQQRFNTELYLNLHKQRIHLYAKPFECHYNDCKQRFVKKVDFVEHKRSHSAEKSLVCDWEGCQQRFRYKPNLNRHKRRVHWKETKYECDYNECKQRFFSLSHLKRHKAIHKKRRFWFSNRSQQKLYSKTFFTTNQK